jgi:hypothetical protein
MVALEQTNGVTDMTECCPEPKLRFVNRNVRPVPQAELDKFAKAMDERVIKPTRARQLRQQKLASAARARFVS